jgi:hypothetical protein
LAQNAIDWHQRDGGFEYGTSKSIVVQLLAKKGMIIHEEAISWRIPKNKEMFWCSLTVTNGMLLISFEVLIKNKTFLNFSLSVEATSTTSNVHANLLAHLELAKKLYDKDILFHNNYYLKQAALNKEKRRNSRM